MTTTERAREERAADAISTLTPTGLTPLAAEARHGYRQAKRITELEAELAKTRTDYDELIADYNTHTNELTRDANKVGDQRDYLLLVIARLEGHNDTDTARLRHLGNQP